MENLTFDLLPEKVSQLSNQLSRIETLLTEQSNKVESKTEKLLTIDEASTFLSLSKATIYTKVSKNEIPFMKRKGSKRLYFSEAELLTFVKEGRQETKSEIKRKAGSLVFKNKKGGYNG